MAEGWIKIHRKLIDWEWFGDLNTCHLFFYLILKANHKDKKWRGVLIKRGQLVTSLQSLSEAMPLTVRQIRTSLDKLKSTKEVTSHVTNRFTMLTIEKYNEYQFNDSDVTSQKSIKRQTDDKQMTTNKNVKNEKEKKEDLDFLKYRNIRTLWRGSIHVMPADVKFMEQYEKDNQDKIKEAAQG